LGLRVLKVLLGTSFEVWPDGSIMNFLYEIHGLRSFAREMRGARRLRWLGMTVAVLPLDRILASKRFVGRPKDLAHLPLLAQTIRLQRRLGGKRRPTMPRLGPVRRKLPGV
jgi:hypothetical protein